MSDDPNVVFGDVNLREAPIRTAADGTPLNPGMGGWPTLRYFNKDTGPGGAVVQQNTKQKICDEFKVGARMIEATKECMKMCDLATGEGCDDDEWAFIKDWRAKSSDDRTAEIASLEHLLHEDTQKSMKKQIKTLQKIQAHGNEL